MTQHDDCTRVGHMLDGARAALRWTANVEWADFIANDQLQAAITYQVQIIGEAAWRLSPHFQAAHGSLPWAEMAKMRHILVHDYMRVDLAVLWQVVQHDLPPLVSSLRAILGEAND